MALFQELWRAGLTIVYVTHEPDVARYASRIVVVRDGQHRLRRAHSGALAARDDEEALAA